MGVLMIRTLMTLTTMPDIFLTATPRTRLTFSASRPAPSDYSLQGGLDRKTIRSYQNGTRVPAIRVPPRPVPLEPYVGYVTARFRGDPHVWGSVCSARSSMPVGTYTRLLRPAGNR